MQGVHSPTHISLDGKFINEILATRMSQSQTKHQIQQQNKLKLSRTLKVKTKLRKVIK